MVQTECITDQQVMRLDTRELGALLISYLSLDQGHVGKQRQHHCRGWGGGHAFVPWELLVMCLSDRLRHRGEATVALEHSACN